MKLLLVNHGTAADWGGGDGVQLRETAKRLRQRGHAVDEVNTDHPDAAGYDLVHLFNCRVLGSFEQQLACCTQAGVPVVVSPIWVALQRAFWGSRGTHAVLKQAVTQGETAATGLLQQLRERRLVVETDAGAIHADGHGDLDMTQQGRIGELLRQADGLLPNSWLELQAVRSDLHWAGDCFEVAHYGVDPSIFLDADAESFLQTTGVRPGYVLQAGRIEPAKNQAMLCWALRHSELRIVLIGSDQHWPSYAELCRSMVGDRLTIIPHLPQPLLASAYAGAAVHVLPSWMETCGLVSLEAALSGTPLVGSTFGHELEYLQGDAWYADPADPDGLKDAVEAAVAAGRTSKRPIAMKRRILEQFNWERTVDATERLYARVLNRSSGTSGNASRRRAAW